MKDAIGGYIFFLGAGMVAGALIVSKSKKLQQLLMNGSKKAEQMYEDMIQKVDETLGNCNCGCETCSDGNSNSENNSKQKQKKSN